MFIFLDSECLENELLTTLGNTRDMSNNGWNINVKFEKSINNNDAEHDERCGSENNWYGWSPNENIGMISATLQGNGSLTLDFGNCFVSGKVNVYLNSNLMATAPANIKNYVTEFSFTHGSLLKIKEEETGIILLESLLLERRP